MLNERQEKLYNFLLDKSTANEFISKEEICTVLSELYPRWKEKTSEHSSSVFALIRKDIRAINRSDAYKIVISSPKGYKIANEKEAKDFINRRFERDLRSLKINWNLKNKFELNGQIIMNSDGIYQEIQSFIEGTNHVRS